VGTDIEKAFFPAESPKNTSYLIQDVNTPWPDELKGTFDLVHQRLGLVCCGGVDPTFEALRRYVELMKPGGWIQLVELQGWTADDDGPAWKDFTTCLTEMIESINSSVTHIDRVKGWFQDLGLTNVEETVLEGNFGTRDDKEFEHVAKKSALLTANSILEVVKSKPCLGYA
jgi:hypothetical protein